MDLRKKKVIIVLGIIDAFETMWEWWNYTSKADKLRIGSWRTIIQMAIEQAESNKSTKVEIPATVIDRTYAFIDIENDFSTQENGIIEMDIQKAK
eukprot:12220989-Heterocapsa_arctica.AAC.1